MGYEHFIKKLIYILICMICVSSMSDEKSDEKTYYEILSVSPTATQEETTQAYNRLMSQPDQKWGNEATMTEVHIAYMTSQR